MYEKQEFYSGQKLQASQLDAMEDGIIQAQKLATEAVAGAANMEKGTGVGAIQQISDGVADGFDFTGKNPNATALDPSLTGIISYGATGDFASAFGGKCAAIGKRSTAEGTTTIAKGKYSHAEGDNSVTLGNDSHAEGYVTVSKGTASHAQNYGTQAIGHSSHAEGNKTVAEGNSSHAEGNETIAKGDNSHAEGYSSEAIGPHSHAEGNDTIAQGVASHAEGDGTQALHENSHAGGYKTQTGRANQTVIGQFNKGKATTFFEVGSGASESDRKNAFEVCLDGDILFYYNGDMYSLHKILALLLNAGISSEDLKSPNQ